jgi:hypothetical protein
MAERDRASVRHRALKQAKVVMHDQSTIDCTLRNLSEGGARLEFSDPVDLPDRFDVLIVSTHRLIPAERAWKRGTAMGVRFTGPERSLPLYTP